MLSAKSIEVINQYLYGSPVTPSQIESESLIRPNPASSIEFDRADYMIFGPGRFVNGASFNIVRDFFSIAGESLPSSPSGGYTKEWIANYFGRESFGANVNQANVSDSVNDLGERVLIHNSTAFKLPSDGELGSGNNLRFHVNSSTGERYIENFAIIPRDTNPPDNFDFEGGNIITNIGNIFLEQIVDPSSIGGTVEFKFNLSNPPIQPKYTYTDILKDFAESAKWGNPSLVEVRQSVDDTLGDLFTSGEIQFLDDDGKPVIFGTVLPDDFISTLTPSGTDIAIGTAFPLRSYLDKYVDNGIHYIAGKGADRVIAPDTDDILNLGEGFDEGFANGGDDTIVGGSGNDTLFGGEGNDIIYGGADRDLINGGTDRDILYGDDGSDTLEGEGGEDRLIGGRGSDTLKGGEDNDELMGGAGDDELTGGGGDSDIALYEGKCSDYSITLNENGTYTVIETELNGIIEGTDNLSSVEYLGFGAVIRDGYLEVDTVFDLSQIEEPNVTYKCPAEFEFSQGTYFGELDFGYGETDFSLVRKGDQSFDVTVDFDGEFTFGDGTFYDFDLPSTTDDPTIEGNIWVDFSEDTERVEVELTASLSEGSASYEDRVVFGNEDGASTTATLIFTDNDPDDDNGTFGDPHLVTTDGLAYDFQAGGDYVLARATEGDPLEVHVRFRSEDDVASYVEAVGTEVDGHKVSFDYADPENGGVLRVDVEETFLSDIGIPVSVGDGVITRKGDDIVIEYSNGESLDIFVGASFLGVGINPFPTRADGSFEGLLGNGDGDASNDLVLSDGTILNHPVSADDLYGAFADSWKVDPASSLLDGEPAPYTMPEAILSIDDFPDDIIAEATALVDEAGITDPQLREWAIYDYAVTQNADYIDGAKEFEDKFEAPDQVLEVEAGKPTIFLTSDQAEIVEGGEGTQTLSFTVSRSDTENLLEVSYSVIGVGENPADGEDFGGELPSGTVLFDAGQATTTIEIEVLGDTSFEADENFELSLSLTGTSADEYVLALSSQEGTIINDDFKDPDLTLVGTDEDDTLTGLGGDDRISGGSGKDYIEGGAGNDKIWGNHGTDTLLGGDGDDRIGDWTGWSTLDGGAGNDKLYAGAGRDTLIGGEGDDTMQGGAHADTFITGLGEDTVLDFARGEDFLQIDGYEFGYEEGQTNPEEFLSTYGSFDNADVVIDLGDGNRVRLLDQIDPDNPPDSVSALTDIFFTGAEEAGSDASDTLTGTPRSDDLEGEAGDDIISGEGASDLLSGGDGADAIYGGDGDDHVSGGAGKDYIEGGAGNDYLHGNHGKDTILGGEGDDFLGDWAGWSYLDGGAGDDRLRAGAGQDTLIGGEGDDIMQGGKHGDTFITGIGHDVIEDFESSEDILQIVGYEFGYDEGQTDPVSFMNDYSFFDEADLVIELDEDNTVRLQNQIDPENPPEDGVFSFAGIFGVEISEDAELLSLASSEETAFDLLFSKVVDEEETAEEEDEAESELDWIL